MDFDKSAFEFAYIKINNAANRQVNINNIFKSISLSDISWVHSTRCDSFNVEFFSSSFAAREKKSRTNFLRAASKRLAGDDNELYSVESAGSYRFLDNERTVNTHFFFVTCYSLSKSLWRIRKKKKHSFRKVFLMRMLLRLVDWVGKKKFCSFSVVKFYCCKKHQGNFQASIIHKINIKDANFWAIMTNRCKSSFQTVERKLENSQYPLDFTRLETWDDIGFTA